MTLDKALNSGCRFKLDEPTWPWCIILNDTVVDSEMLDDPFPWDLEDFKRLYKDVHEVWILHPHDVYSKQFNYKLSNILNET